MASSTATIATATSIANCRIGAESACETTESRVTGSSMSPALTCPPSPPAVQRPRGPGLHKDAAGSGLWSGEGGIPVAWQRRQQQPAVQSAGKASHHPVAGPMAEMLDEEDKENCPPRTTAFLGHQTPTTGEMAPVREGDKAHFGLGDGKRTAESETEAATPGLLPVGAQDVGHTVQQLPGHGQPFGYGFYFANIGGFRYQVRRPVESWKYSELILPLVRMLTVLVPSPKRMSTVMSILLSTPTLQKRSSIAEIKVPFSLGSK
ncbi:unnamed protein product [Protopolystoma xenopodis]|uniref:Uncharacterized protein n=1 Tax=Protopolystoma xenopodis TaxID=117903 RepID=A0A3S5FEF3_9PLAT|nr:unnamed protein product [Protopolystoma xenopodis]